MTQKTLLCVMSGTKKKAAVFNFEGLRTEHRSFGSAGLLEHCGAGYVEGIYVVMADIEGWSDATLRNIPHYIAGIVMEDNIEHGEHLSALRLFLGGHILQDHNRNITSLRLQTSRPRHRAISIFA